MKGQSNNDRDALTRGEIERLCLLGAIPDSGCTPEELTPRLGLSPLLHGAVAAALAPLVDSGLVEKSEASVVRSQSGERELRRSRE